MKRINAWYRRATAAVMVTAHCVGTAAASSTGIDAPAKNLIDLVFTFMKYGGIILIIAGLAQFFLALNNHDSTQKMAGIGMVFAGFVMVFLKNVLNAIGITW